MFKDVGDVAAEGLGLSAKQRQLVIRVLWVLVVTTHMMWVWGMLAILGFGFPYARATDLEELRQSVAISARLQIIQEIRTQKRVYCTNTDEKVRDSTLRYLYSLVDDLKKVDPRIQETPVPDCEHQ